MEPLPLPLAYAETERDSMPLRGIRFVSILVLMLTSADLILKIFVRETQHGDYSSREMFSTLGDFRNGLGTFYGAYLIDWTRDMRIGCLGAMVAVTAICIARACGGNRLAAEKRAVLLGWTSLFASYVFPGTVPLVRWTSLSCGM